MKKLFLMGVPHHGNIGDNAIAIAEEQIINKFFPKLELIRLPEKDLIEKLEQIRVKISNDDIILLHGGGNIGDTYFVPEQGRRYVLQNFPNNKTIVFPQTAFFDDKKELEISKKIYNAHSDLTIMGREKKSYHFMKKEFYNCKVFLTPDIVLTMKKAMNLERKDIIVMFRNDREKTLTQEAQDNIKKVLNKRFGNFLQTDMHLGEDVTDMEGKKREEVLNAKFEQFNRAKLVITDRLHGMIFAAITETPCVVIGSYTHKIEESYNKWLKSLEYIRFCKNINTLETDIETVLNSKNRDYDNTFAEKTISQILTDKIF